ncbi:3-deoxy-D-manno-octulosonic acid transferase [Dyadobacter sp. CY312]|uniref:3-deoxy-D-manno-octulosonic acid transferase n=1 Tax=Dyadobacter sp. CY312 TaxID=2907303 RepID=UPI001F200361|nr:glycosyltransferase N-terminal domain-containing protein [Dyadobacter sp. CY312]MCE7041870.1 3-deoxy-D-manno-octulosonic acid transferase [Dyadobacter sp. CY312]
MTAFAYQIFIIAFQFLMRFAGLFSHKIKLGVEGRKSLLADLDVSFPKLVNGRPVAWFHAASLGEFEQGRPVIEAFRERYPDYFIFLTFFSPSGYEIRKNYAGADHICYLPIDTKTNAAEFIRIVKPRIVFFIKYEFWFNYLRELRKSGAFIYSFSTIFRPGQVFFKWYGSFYRKLLTYFDHIFVQNEESLQLLKSIHIDHCSLAGDTRFDRVSAIASSVKDLPLVAAFKGDRVCMVAGSVWEADMEVLIPAVNALKKPVKMIIAPHEIKSEEIESWRGKLSGSSVLYSEFVKGNNQEADYLFIDNIGMLSSLYRYGDMAYIGGSFGSGLHNILEAATFGLPVTFGDKGYRKFQEAKDLIEEGGAVAVSNVENLIRLIQKWCDPVVRTQTGEISKAYVARQIGATNIVLATVQEKLG